MILCRVRPEVLRIGSPLWHWHQMDMVLWGYPIKKQREVEANREKGRKGGQAKTQAKTQAARDNGLHGGRPETQAETEAGTQAKPKPKPNGREWKGMEGNIRKGREDKGVSVDVLAIYSAYPKHVAKGDALKAIRSVIASGRTPGELLERTEAYAAAVARWPEEERSRFVPHPATWFRRGSFDDDPAAWERKNSDGSDQRDDGFDPSKPNAHTGGVPLAN
jgi:hypothetical protein